MSAALQSASVQKQAVVPLELYDLQTYTKASEFARSSVAKLWEGYDTHPDDVRASLRVFAEDIFATATPEEVGRALTALDSEVAQFNQKLTEAIARANNAGKKKSGHINTSERANDDLDADGNEDEDEEDEEDDYDEHGRRQRSRRGKGKKKGAPAASVSKAQDEDEGPREDVEELDMAELDRRAQEQEEEHKREEERERAEEEARRKKAEENERMQQALREKQRRTVDLPEGYTILSSGNNDKKKKK